MNRIKFGNGHAWFGEHDSPAPLNYVSDPSPHLTIGITAKYSGVAVVVRYRRAGDTSWSSLEVRKAARSGSTQYFSTRFPRFSRGTRVEYEVWLKPSGLYPIQEQRLGEIQWFEVADTTNNRNDKVRSTQQASESSVASKTDPPIETSTENASISDDGSDIDEDNDVTSDSKDGESQFPFQFSSGDKKRLNCLKCSLSKEQPKAKLQSLFEKAKGDFSRINALVEEDEAFDGSSIRKLNFAHDLAELTEDNEKLVGTFLANSKTHCLRDIALNVKKDELNALIKTKVPVVDKEEAARNINDRLFRMAPAAVIHRMARDHELETDEPVRNGLLTFFDAHPELDFRKESILKTLEKPKALENIPEAQRDKVVHSLKCCQRLASICPTAEAVPKLMKAGLDSAYAINEVPQERFIKLYSASLGGEDVAKRIHAQAQNINVRNEHSLIALRDAVLSPSVNSVHGGQSVNARRAVAVQIAQQKDIPINFGTLFGNVDLCECKHCNSVYSPAAYLVELFQYLRNNNLDPDLEKEIPVSKHTGELGIGDTPLEKLFRRRPDLGELQLTCENTNTLIPYIDLVNEVMESFVVNLQDYEQDNNVPKEAKIEVHNVEDESSGELLAEPHHTCYKAYRILKNAVYPVCKLPYYQPIDATRKYLNFLGTSRYELFSTFRSDEFFTPDENTSAEETKRQKRLIELKNQTVDRTIAAEYLELVEEEYVILTKQGFHTQEYYELYDQEKLTKGQYHDKIGLKNTWAYYGIGNENAMLDELKWVKPAQETGLVGFLRRVNMLYIDLIELLKTRYINPNYPSGKALAFMNSLPYSYRYLQTLVDESQANIQSKYLQLINFLQTNLDSYGDNRFDKKYVACWVYIYFEKVGKLIVLENASPCNCIEGNFFINVAYSGYYGGTDITINLFLELTLNLDCQIHIKGSDPKKLIGHLEGGTGKLQFDIKKLFDTISGPWSNDMEFLEQLLASAKVEFIGNNGEKGWVKDLTLYIGRHPFFCAIEKETCDITKTQLQHLDGSSLSTTEYDRIHRFIRLWCKLDWSIDEVNQAITGVGETINNPPAGVLNFSASTFITFQPTFPTDDENDLEFQDNIRNSNPALSTRNSVSTRLSRIVPEDDPEPFDGTIAVNPPGGDPKPGIDDLTFEPLVVDPADCKAEEGDLEIYEITPYLIDQLVAVKELQKITGLDLDKLLTFWTSIGIAGEKPLYEQLFLKYNLIAEDDIFQADDYGTYLTREKEKDGKTPIIISNHLPSLMAAFKVDVGMLEKTASYAGIGSELSLVNVSHIYRHVLLAKSLGLRIKQLPALFELIKDQAHPFSQPTNTLKFFKLFERIDDSGFDTRELNYLIRNEDDEYKPLRPTDLKLFRLAISLRDALLQIDIDHADINDDVEATEELLREKLSLLFDGAVVEQMIGLVQGSTVYEDNTRRKYSANLTDDDASDISSFLFGERKNYENNPDEPLNAFLSKVQFSEIKGLQITGILSDSDSDRLHELADLISNENEDDKEKFLIAVNKMLTQPSLFFDDALATIFPDKETTEEARVVLLAEDTLDSEGNELSALQKSVFLLDKFLPYLRDQLQKRQVVQILSSDLGLNQDLTEKLVMEIIKTDNDETIYQEIIRLKQQKDPVEEEQEEPLSWQGYFVPEKEGRYLFLLEAESDQATLSIDSRQQWLKSERVDEEQIYFYQSQKALFLKGGHTYTFNVQGYDQNESGKIIGLFFKFNNQPQTEISDKHLFPALRTENFIAAYIKLFKSAILLDGFAMKLEELALFREFPESFENQDFNTLSFPQWLRLEAFYRLNKSLPAKEFGFVEFLRWSNTTEDADSTPLLKEQIARLTGWEETEVCKLLEPGHFNLSHPMYFQDEQNLLTLQKTLKVVHQIGLDIDQLFKWGEPPVTFGAAKTISGAIREVIRARYQQDEWEEAIKSVHDELRENQKQALIAYLLAQPVLMNWGVRDADSLFEFFLIDVQMDACMETSRIKQAISSVQLYVQRCFLGLEDKHGVGSEILDRQRWEWMSRYRVWEANRKVFLYPENWIEPGLRDDKSPFFEELESELLQNDVSQDTVKSALTKYIVQVDEVANLEVVGQYTERDTVWRKLHIIGRTRNAPYFYYYRCYDFDTKYWCAWEKVEVDIPAVNIEDENGQEIENGTFIVPVVWLNRLFLFFPEFMQKSWSSSVCQKVSIADSAEGPPTNCAPLPYHEIKMAWSEYKEGKWTPKQISNGAIYSLKIKDNKTFYQQVKILLHREKFIFAPFVKEDKVVIQPYYLGKTQSVTDEFKTLTDEEKEEQLKNENGFSRLNIYGDASMSLSESFVFNGNQIKKVNYPVSDVVVPITWIGQHVFHREVSNSDSTLKPIQADETEKNPGGYFTPMFLEKNDDNIFITLDTYPIQHKQTKNLLGNLRIDKLNEIFSSGVPLIPLHNDNYGSNDGIHYNELLRPYSIYNWETLFHSVALLAENLSKSQRFEESMTWWHYIFDPINVKGDVKNVWRFLPFWATDSKNVLETIFNRLDPNTPDDEITEWRENPFMPHVIARGRSSAYMKWVVMKYIDNLIAWGDSLFRQDTIESINQATQLYILAGHILGPRPEIIPKRGKIQPKSYMNLVNEGDAFSNAMVDLELIFPFSNQIATQAIGDSNPPFINVYGFATTLYFCIPDNPKLLEYWDTVADRLFKIRHCLNIEGVFRKLKLFEPPIDPALLVQAAAQGLSIGSVLNDLSTPMPNYRFNYLLARASEVISEVKSLGNALLSVLEKKDGESLSQLRSRHDTHIQTLIMEVRNKQLEEAQKTKESLEENRKAPEYRLSYFSQLLGRIILPPGEKEEFSGLQSVFSEFTTDSGELALNTYELEDLKKASEAKEMQLFVGLTEVLASIMHVIPSLSLDFKPIGIGVGMSFGGSNLGSAYQGIARFYQTDVNKLNFESGRAGKKSGFLRQVQDRVYQANLAGREIKQIDKQITTHQIRIELAEKEIENHQIQIDQAKEAEEFIRSKFSNEQLYQWMSDQLKDLYYQTYSFAYDLAKKAEKVYRFDMGLSTSDFIKFGYWNSSKEGFLAGEQLYLALKQLENAYIVTKSHDYEITNPISLRQFNPLALIELKEEGVCEFNLAEELFDLDYPGQYKRRIKTVAVSIPCIVGPHTSLNCTLRLLKHEFRNSKIAANYAKNLEEADERFITNPIPTTAIAVSQGQNDSGVFELSFQSERYLPFEGSGAISTWRLELPQKFRQFDYQTITDVVIHLRYTSCEGGDTMKDAALGHLNDYVSDAAELSKTEGLFRMFSLPHEFPNEWHRLFNPEPDVENQILHLGNLKEKFPFFAQSQQAGPVKIVDIRLFIPTPEEESLPADLQISILRSEMAENLAGNPIIELSLGASTGNLQQYSATDEDVELIDFWGIQFNAEEALTKNRLKNTWMVIKYQFG